MLVAACQRSPAGATADAGESARPIRTASCDRGQAAGTCSEYTGTYLDQNEFLLKSSCGKLGGAFVFAACPNTSVVGDCTLSTSEVRRFYGTGASAFDPERGRTSCEGTFRGSWRAR